MQWQCLPVPTDAQGQPAIPHTTVSKVFARWADAGSLWQAFVARVRHLAAEQHLALSLLHGDGTNTVAKKGRWPRLCRPQAPEGRESHRHYRQSWLCLSACPCG